MVVSNIFPRELIGKTITIIQAAHRSLIGWSGKVIDETKNCLKVAHQGQVKTLLKNSLVFRINETQKIISGSQITKRPEDRLKGNRLKIMSRG